MHITNNGGISLALAVWLVHDEYDYVNEENYMSATKLMRPIRQIVLPHRIPAQNRENPDVGDYVARALGHSLHDSIEKAWKKGYRTNLAKLGYPEHVIDKVLINPEVPPADDEIAVYIEQREKREIIGYTIGGKFDMVAEGIVMDNKSTSAFTWMYGGRDEEHKLQGSIYKWLNPKKITEDFIRINYIFTDWQKSATSNPKYPQRRVESKDIPLMTIEETERWIVGKLTAINAYMNADEKTVPRCTKEELWMSDPEYKYYSDPTKTSGRSTKNFDSQHEANMHLSKAGKGVIKIVPAEPKRCGYCEAFDACTQKDEYFS